MSTNKENITSQTSNDLHIQNKQCDRALIDRDQFLIFQKLVKGDDVNINDPKFIELALQRYKKFSDFIDSLVKTRLISRNGDQLAFTKGPCQIAVLPDGRILASNQSNDSTIRKRYN